MTSSKRSKTSTSSSPPATGELRITTLNTSDLTKDLKRFSLVDTLADLADELADPEHPINHNPHPDDDCPAHDPSGEHRVRIFQLRYNRSPQDRRR